MGLIKFAMLLAVIHLGVFGVGEVYVENIKRGAAQGAYYGGEKGFLPATDGAYGTFTNWLYNADGQHELEPKEPEQGVVGTMQSLIGGGVCATYHLLRWGAIIATFSYPMLSELPEEGFGLWVRIIINLGSLASVIFLGYHGLEIAMRAGVFGNVYLLVALGVLGSITILGNIIQGGAKFAC